MTEKRQPPRDEKALTADLQAMSEASAEASAFLAQIGEALFPKGTDLAHLTWPEKRPAAPAGEKEAPVLDERANTEAKLRAAEARYRTLIEQIPAVTFMAVLGEGKNEIYVSPHIEAMLGFTQEEWLENPFLWYTQLHPQDRELWNQEFARGCRTGGPFQAECRFMARDGRLVWVHGEARLVKDEIGRPQFLQGVAFDITESKHAQSIVLNAAVNAAKTEEDVAIAHRIQDSILPKTFVVEGLEIAATMIPATEVGGDYYDVLPFDGGAWIAIGDVAGHGLNAGIVMLMVQSAMSAILRARPHAPPREVLCTLNAVLVENIRTRLKQDEHVTLTLMRYSIDGTIVFAGAHEDILIVRNGGQTIQTIQPPGTWLGASRDIERATVDTIIHLEDGDTVVVYTDGVTESRNAERQQFDMDRLRASILESAVEGPTRVRDHVLDDVRRWMVTQEDDITLFVFRYRTT